MSEAYNKGRDIIVKALRKYQKKHQIEDFENVQLMIFLYSADGNYTDYSPSKLQYRIYNKFVTLLDKIRFEDVYDPLIDLFGVRDKAPMNMFKFFLVFADKYGIEASKMQAFISQIGGQDSITIFSNGQFVAVADLRAMFS